jgi:hypothetical protein
MKELKTLKDLEVRESSVSKDWMVSRDRLKAEAVKWVKNTGKYLCEEDWIDFFNLTEEDLK